jgi:AcrR family transcriptional regulator
VPSTRALARRWKVAEATAARALRLLVQKGILLASPRSGTVVAPATPTETRGELSRPRIVAAAVRAADEEGLGALTLRGLASRLGAPVMSLYRHVRSKEELVVLMAEAAMAELPLPAEPPAGWRAQLELASRLEWRSMRRHPWLARVVHISRPSATPAALAFVEWVLRALDGAALDEAGKLHVHLCLHGFVQGLAVNIEAEAQAAGDTGITEAEHMHVEEPRFETLAAQGRYPHFARMLRGLQAGFELDIDQLFEVGLAALLDGFTASIEGPAPAARARRRRARR